MKKIFSPLLIAALLISGLSAAMGKANRDLQAARAENAVLAERLSRAEAVSAAVMRIDAMSREAKIENAALTKRLAAAEAALDGRQARLHRKSAAAARRRAIAQASPRGQQTEFKDAVADAPRRARRGVRAVALPGYAD